MSLSVLKDISGKRFGLLEVIMRAGSSRSRGSTWLCKCDCGSTKVFSSDHLTRKTNPVRSCGCQRVKQGSNHAQWTGCGDISGSWWYNHVLRELFGKSRRSQLMVDLTIEQAWNLFLQQGKKCALSGLSINIAYDGTASLDRINSSKGYTLSNVQWVHKDINFMKRTYSQEYFIHMCKLVASNDGVCELPQNYFIKELEPV